MNVLVVGGGGREHVLVWKLAKSPSVDKIYCTPGNAGIQKIADCTDIDPRDISSLVEFAKEKDIDLTVPGPEQPLVEGLVDEFRSNSLLAFGPDSKAARIEGSKAFSKDLMVRHGIPTARFDVFANPANAQKFADNLGYPVVIKADGLAAGKGAVICADAEEAAEAIDTIMVEQKFGKAGEKVVVEEFLEGTELSIFAIVSGMDILMLPPSQDHKAVYDGDKGPNTGGMGAYSPVSAVSDKDLAVIERDIIVQTVHAMVSEGCPFSGVLYAGLMLTSKGPHVLEFNCRFGDPEAQVVIPRYRGDFAKLLYAAASGDLEQANIVPDIDPRAAVCVVLASGGYPLSYKKGYPITGLDGIEDEDVTVFHAGTRMKLDQVVTAGGRVLGVTALGSSITEARSRAYAAVSAIEFDGVHFRTDIGRRERG
ncbi:MAG: phosphoribosylamine--glycine ligase [Planctomycetota bacterium]|nr:phosphoribosylamine--glycine ligase [Planctomycetota bacterium]